MPAPLGRADLHVHPLAGDDHPLDAESLLALLADTTLDVVALTEHDRLDVTLEVRELARQRGISVEVVPGEEISTRSGHLTGLWLERAVAPGMSLRDAIAAVHRGGGLAVAAHPLLAGCIGLRALISAASDPDPLYRLDGVEIRNPIAAAIPGYTSLLTRIARRHNLALIGGSDAHASAPGTAYTLFAGRTAVDLRRAIEMRSTSAEGETEPLLRFLFHLPKRAIRGVQRHRRMLRQTPPASLTQDD